MMAFDYSVDIRTWLIATTGSEVFHNFVGEATDRPYIWFRLSGEVKDQCFDSDAGDPPLRQDYDVEIYDTSLAGAVETARLIKDALPMRGDVGSTTAKMLDYESHDEGYELQAQFSDEVSHSQSLLLRLFP